MSAVLAAYDIPDDRRRARVAKVLLRFGPRAQYSVFLARRGSAPEIVKALVGIIDATHDDVRIYPLCATCIGKTVLLGRRAREAALPAGLRVV